VKISNFVSVAMLRILALLAFAFTVTTMMAAQIVVNCDAGQSLNRTLAQLDGRTRATIWVKGTCTEYVQIKGLDGITLNGFPGATLVQPATAPTNLFIATLLIGTSRSVTVDGLTVRSPASGNSGIGIGQGSSDIRLRNLKVQGGGEGIIIFENSQVSLAGVTARDAGYTPVGVYDTSDVHIENCLFDNSTENSYHVGIDVGSGHVTIRGTTIRNMQVGINIYDGGGVDVNNFNTYFPLTRRSDVVIDNPAGTNFNGVAVAEGSSLVLNSAILRIINPGQPWGGNTGGILVTNGSTLNAYANLEVSGSKGSGVFVTNNSHASLAGSRITGGAHGGLVVANLSTIAVGSSSPGTEVSANGTDLFCDSKSLITGAAGIINASTVQCSNLVTGDSEPTP
jgi:hypothetical protein